MASSCDSSNRLDYETGDDGGLLATIHPRILENPSGFFYIMLPPPLVSRGTFPVIGTARGYAQGRLFHTVPFYWLPEMDACHCAVIIVNRK